jgi:hypothetical protein
MKTIFDSIVVNYAEYSYFKQLPVASQIDYFFEVYEAAEIRSTGLDLSKFFNAIKDSFVEDVIPQQQHAAEDSDNVDVMIDDRNMMIESNSLKALRYIVYKFIESGYILRRDLNMEKMFKRDKITKYLRIFQIVDQTSSICTN